jgi:cellulose synthase/poly-beta-1,6-N-acetylglucosamine synthase-like glycosyltransferase
MIYAVIILVLTLGYVFLILNYLRVWESIPDTEQGNTVPSTFLSIIIPARNESQRILQTIQSILSQNYPKHLFEIIVVDDHSDDDTASKVLGIQHAQVRLIKLENKQLKEGEVAYKKRAIEAGIEESKGEIIITTDADCTHHKDWLVTIAANFESKLVNMVSGSVLFEYEENWFQKFQALDFLGMIGITAASIQMGMFNLANGANLAYRKSVFNTVGGFKGIDDKASGDDMLLIYKFALVDASKVLFLKSKGAVTYTKCAVNLSEFIQQRLRWTSKSFSYQDKRITWILAFVYIVNVGLFSSLCLALFKWDFIYFLLFMFQFAAMCAVDYLFLNKVSKYYSRKALLNSFLSSQLIHVVYILAIGLMGNLVQYDWKGRKLK